MLYYLLINYIYYINYFYYINYIYYSIISEVLELVYSGEVNVTWGSTMAYIYQVYYSK
jgi:hypothetical protein